MSRHDEVARARELFLEREAADLTVRRVILASWQRSRESSVDCDEIQVPFIEEHNAGTPLLACASDILDALHEQLQYEPVSIVLTDSSGIVLDRRVTSTDLARRLDAVSLAPGFSYAEHHAGTNGIGTAISSGQAAFVDGREHYTNQLGQFACAGAPIHHPSRGTVVGILDLTCYAHSPGSMLMALAKSTARQIETELLTQTGMREMTLFLSYIRESQRSGAPVLAMNGEVVMMNDRLREVLDGHEQQALISYAAEGLAASRGFSRTVELPSGRSAQLRATPVPGDRGLAGWLFRVRPIQHEVGSSAGARPIRADRASRPPGLAGHSTAWLRCIEQVSACHAAGDWTTLIGEPGAGKRTLLRAVHHHRCPGAPVQVLEPPRPNEVEDWLARIREAAVLPSALVVLPRVDRLPVELQGVLVNELCELPAFDGEPARRPRVAITLDAAGADTGPLAAAFPRTVEVPPLRHHIDDLPELVVHLLGQLTGEGRLQMSKQALDQLRRLDWPGNVTELRSVLAAVVRHKRTGVIELADLPPGARASRHRKLSQMETIERDAIVRALLENGQNPARSAAALGISRATIYRKLRQFGISLPLAH